MMNRYELNPEEEIALALTAGFVVAFAVVGVLASGVALWAAHNWRAR